MSEQYVKIIEESFCNKEEGGYSIHKLIEKMIFLELIYGIFISKINTNNSEGTILESQLLQNFFHIGYVYSQINIISKLLDTINHEPNSLYYLWQNTKEMLPKDTKYKEVEKYFENLKKDDVLGKIKYVRDKIICHNDKNACKDTDVDLLECTKGIFKIYSYFNGFLSYVDFDFLNLCDESLILDEIKKLQMPFIKTKEDEELFKNKWQEQLNNFDLEIMTFIKKMNLANKYVKVEIRSY